MNISFQTGCFFNYYNYSGEYSDSIDLIGRGLHPCCEVIIAGTIIFKMTT